MSELNIQVESLQNLLVSKATGGLENDAEFIKLRKVVIEQPQLDSVIPAFLKTCRNLAQFWQFIKYEFPSYHERRNFIWGQFQPMLDVLEAGGPAPADKNASKVFERFDSKYVQTAWSKALDRRNDDPEGAITMARTLVEAVCKHILDESKIEYGDSPDLNKLYRLTAESLNLAPSQHTELVFKQILGGCTTVVEGLGALRNRLSDSHGRGKVAVKPAARHAELAVNLAGALSVFLISTSEAATKNST